VIAVEGLAKSFRVKNAGRWQAYPALVDVSFQAPDGRITGLLGPNGAGKTTTLRIVSTLVQADAGSARVDGIDCRAHALSVRSRLGVLSDARGLYPRLTARENIRYYGALRAMAPAAIEAGIDQLAELIEMRELLDRRTEGFSQGERMKVALARALLHDPQNLLLDEPTNGLDIMSTRALRALLRRLRDAGKCIVFSSHVMQEVSALCDDIVIVSHGRTVAQGSAPALLARTGAADLEEAFVTLAFQPAGAAP
jgi:sodium transport system ATP-binding protein